MGFSIDKKSNKKYVLFVVILVLVFWFLLAANMDADICVVFIIALGMTGYIFLWLWFISVINQERNNNDENNSINQAQIFEHAEAAMVDIAMVSAGYYKALVQNGFTEEQAFILARDYLRISLGALMSNEGNDNPGKE